MIQQVIAEGDDGKLFAYWGLLVFFFVVTLFFKNTKMSDSSAKRGFILLTFVILIMMAGLRNEDVGTDTVHYTDLFQRMARIYSWKDLQQIRYEPGFMILLKLISLISDEPTVMIFVTSAIIVFLYGRYIIKCSTDIYMSFMLFVLLGFYMNSFNIMRQHIAIGICLNGLLFLNKPGLGKTKSIFLFVASVFLASQFHMSAWIFLIVLLVPLSKKFPLVIILEGIAAVVLFLFKNEIALLISTWFGYEDYLVSYAQRASYLQFTTYSVILVFVFLFLWVIEKRKDVFESIKMEFHILCFAMVIMTIALSQYGLIVRIADYFKPVIIIIMPKLFQSLKEKDRVIAICMVCAVCCLFYGWNLYVNNGEVVPYISAFN